MNHLPIEDKHINLCTQIFLSPFYVDYNLSNVIPSPIPLGSGTGWVREWWEVLCDNTVMLAFYYNCPPLITLRNPILITHNPFQNPPSTLRNITYHPPILIPNPFHYFTKHNPRSIHFLNPT